MRLKVEGLVDHLSAKPTLNITSLTQSSCHDCVRISFPNVRSKRGLVTSSSADGANMLQFEQYVSIYRGLDARDD